MSIRLPGQKVNISPRLQSLFSQTRAECSRDIKFGAISEQDFVGRTLWRDTEVLIQIRDTLDNSIAEYIAAHELCHALQLARGYPIAAGRADEPETVGIAIQITDFLFDSSADAMAVKFGFPMALNFQRWLELTGLLEVVNKPKNGRRYGNNWAKIWERLEAISLCRQLDLKLPQPPKDFWTLWVAFSLANIIQRASNFGLTTGLEIRDNIRRLPLLSRVVDDLLNIGTSAVICNIEESLSRLVSIFNYIKAPAGHVFISKPLTGEIYIDSHWQRQDDF